MSNQLDTAKEATVEDAGGLPERDEGVAGQWRAWLVSARLARHSANETIMRGVVAPSEHSASQCDRAAAGGSPLRGGLAPWQLRRSQVYMLKHMNDSVCVESVASECGISVNHFVRAFKGSVGTTPHRWLMTERLKVAMTLMYDDNQSLAQIAVACGFSDQSHLTRVFSARIGIPPGQWRRNLKAMQPAVSPRIRALVHSWPAIASLLA
ncbi:AraC-like DNA-binding protein [Paraburkholderia unamae]|uniref:AraC-like DNA-binding protein n=2 Tax=Paraburkholderia unamae TaxID=219649 RepID=A0ABX5KSV0_9BURK|nr:AraC-like DNA-binding protein [Paraburkholderia unamae]